VAASKVRRQFARQPDAQLARAHDPAALLRETTYHYGGGVFLGLGCERREWIAAHPEHAIMVLGPPRSGKTSAVVIPAILSATGAVVSTSTKLDVFAATASHRSQWGNVWVFDPSGTSHMPPGARRLRWSPVSAGRPWDETLTTAAAMVDAAKLGSGGDSEFWNERAGALLAGLLHAASLDRRTIADVRAWVLRADLDSPIVILQSHGAKLAAEILDGLSRATDRALSSVFATASSV
jgi:type IV secretory pathway TraG/TraD family ATPase VirD4